MQFSGLKTCTEAWGRAAAILYLFLKLSPLWSPSSLFYYKLVQDLPNDHTSNDSSTVLIIIVLPKSAVANFLDRITGSRQHAWYHRCYRICKLIILQAFVTYAPSDKLAWNRRAMTCQFAHCKCRFGELYMWSKGRGVLRYYNCASAVHWAGLGLECSKCSLCTLIEDAISIHSFTQSATCLESTLTHHICKAMPQQQKTIGMCTALLVYVHCIVSSKRLKDL